jgi:hypothetical protein
MLLRIGALEDLYRTALTASSLPIGQITNKFHRSILVVVC